MLDSELKTLMDKYDAEQRIDEIIWFYRYCEQLKPKVIVEIGNKEGGNLKILSTHLSKDGLCIGVDWRKDGIPWKGDDALCPVMFVNGDTHKKETLDQVTAILHDRPIDVLFIDGDHSYEGMLADARDYGPLVRNGGIIAVHDIYYLRAVADAWRDLPIKGYRYQTARNQSSIGIGFVYKED